MLLAAGGHEAGDLRVVREHHGQASSTLREAAIDRTVVFVCPNSRIVNKFVNFPQAISVKNSRVLFGNRGIVFNLALLY